MDVTENAWEYVQLLQETAEHGLPSNWQDRGPQAYADHLYEDLLHDKQECLQAVEKHPDFEQAQAAYKLVYKVDPWLGISSSGYHAVGVFAQEDALRIMAHYDSCVNQQSLWDAPVELMLADGIVSHGNVYYTLAIVGNHRPDPTTYRVVNVYITSILTSCN